MVANPVALGNAPIPKRDSGQFARPGDELLPAMQKRRDRGHLSYGQRVTGVDAPRRVQFNVFPSADKPKSRVSGCGASLPLRLVRVALIMIRLSDVRSTPVTV